MADLDVSFMATIGTKGILRCVDVPRDCTSGLEGRAQVPVVVDLGGNPVRSALAPRSGGGFRVFLQSTLRREAGVDAGDRVQVRVRMDPRCWDVDVPEDLAGEVRRTPGATAMFESLTPGLRRELIRWVEEAKSPETRQRRVKDGIQKLLDRALERARPTPKKSSASRKKAPTRAPDPRSGLDSLLALYPPPVTDLVHRTRKLLFEVLPTLQEEVDLPGKLIAYSIGHRSSDAVFRLHPSRRGLKLCFQEGAGLSDPRGLLSGAGQRHRHFLLEQVSDLRRAGLRPLLRAAEKAVRARSAQG